MTNNIQNLPKEFLRASQKGDLAKLKYLTCQYGIKDWTVYRHDVSGDTALHIAAREGHLEIVKYLCNDWPYPAFKVDVANKDMKRPLHEAAQFARSSIVEFLIEEGATVDALKRADWTPLMLACTKDGSNALKCVQLLLDAGVNLEVKNKDGWIALLIACRTGDVDIIKSLLETKPDSITTTSKNGRTALHIAALHSHLDAIDVIFKVEPSLIHTFDFTNSPPLFEAVKSLNYSVFEKVIDYGADIEIVDTIGQTILHVAVSVGNVKVINYILSRGLINVQSSDNFGTSPLALAQKYKLDNVIDLLMKYN